VSLPRAALFVFERPGGSRAFRVRLGPLAVICVYHDLLRRLEALLPCPARECDPPLSL
jgi:hypothetical protein